MKRWLIRLLVLAGSLLALLYAYYISYEQFARHLVFDEHIYYEEANSIKHAYAVVHFYELFDTVLNDDDTVAAIVALGIANERIEQVIRFPKDSASESAKDLCNNLTAAVAARWMKQRGHPLHARELAMLLNEKKLLKQREDSITIDGPEANSKGQAAVDAALKKVNALATEIIETVEKALAGSVR